MTGTPAPPRYGTRRRPERATTGGRLARIASLLDVELHPWQRYVFDVAGELDPATGHHAYTIVTVSVGRRAGKSIATLVRGAGALLTGAGRAAWYTAQTRNDAALELLDAWAPRIEASRAGSMLHVRRSNGSEAVESPRTRSRLRVFAPVRGALDGKDSDLVVFDECWAFDRDRGAELVRSASPTTMTRPGAQRWHVSAAGDVDSTWWADLVDAGRRAVALDTGRGWCHFEWTADTSGLDDVDELDPADPATWASSHPAFYPGGTVAEQWLRDEYDRDPVDFSRTVLNVTDRTGSTGAPIDPAVWATLAVPRIADRDRVSLGVAVAADQVAAAIVACVVDRSVPVVELVDHRDGYRWVVDRLDELADRWDVVTVAADWTGPTAVLRRPVDALALPVASMTASDVVAAPADLVAAIRTGVVRHVPDPRLDVTAGRRRSIGDGAWTWRRDDVERDPTALIAATWARWAHPDIVATADPSIR